MAADFFLKVPNMPGDSKDNTHPDWIEVDSWHFGISNNTDPGRGSGATKGVGQFSEFTFTKRADRSSPLIFKSNCMGDHIASIQFAAKKAGAKQGQTDYLTVNFTDCIISSLTQSGGGGEDVMPTENVSFSFATISFEYQFVDVQGNKSPAIAFKYDLKANKAL